MDSTEYPIRYNDIYFRIITSLIAAHMIVSFGAKQSFFQLLIFWPYYRSLLLSFAIAFFLVSLVYFFTVKLDKHFGWKQHTAQRIGLQVLLGLVLPSVVAFLLAAAYFGVFGLNILKNTYYLEFDFPVVSIMLLLFNVYYLAFYFFRQWQLMEKKMAAANNIPIDKNGQAVFIVQKGAKNIPIQTSAISYFYHEGDYNFVRTFEREDFLIPQALDEVQQLLNDQQFFRVNRQMIVNFASCQHFESLEYGKLELIITPEPKEQVVISQKRAKAFKEWIKR